MKFLGATLGWLVLFCALGAGFTLGFGRLEFHIAMHAKATLELVTLGTELGVTLFIFAFCFAALPGARRKPGSAPELGLLQGVWGMAGFGITMAGGGLLVANVLTFANFILIARHNPMRLDLAGHGLLVGSAIGGEIAAAIWVLWYFMRLGPILLGDGSATGIAWRSASPGAYFAAILAALGIILLVAGIYRLAPPDLNKIEALPMAKLFTGSAITVVPLLIIAIFIGPALEEMVFRGIAFAGIAARLGPVWAGAITTLIFMAAHAPEKIYYKPGFIDVGLMAIVAVWMRLKFRSIKPGILLHIVYNAGSMVAASLM